MKTVSVIVPVYNTSPYLERCLESLLAQTYRDIEILAIDDGSTDGSYGICQRLAERDARLRCFRLPHEGVSAARNKGLAEMNGEYISFVDSDDWLEPDTLRTLVGDMEDNDADVVFYNVTCEWPDRAALRVARPLAGLADREELLQQALRSVDQEGRAYGYYLCVTNKLFRVSSLTEGEQGLRPFDTGVRMLEDGLWLMHYLPRFTRGFLNAKGFYHRTYRPDSVTGDDEKWFENARDYILSYSSLAGLVRQAGSPQADALATASLYGAVENAMRRDAREAGGGRVEQLLRLLNDEDREAFLLRQLNEWMRERESEAYNMGRRLYACAPVRVPYQWAKKMYRVLKKK